MNGSLRAARSALFFCAAALPPLLTGCSAGGGGSLGGKVTYNGEPVTGGRIVLRPRGGPANGADDIRADIKPDGTFSVHGVGAGEFAVGVDTECLRPEASPESPRPGGRKPAGAKGAPPAEGPPAGTYVPLPARFRYPASSGVTWNTEKEGLKKDISLAD